MERLRTALLFLTRIPWPRGNDSQLYDLGRAAAAFPLVGGLVGGLTALVVVALALVLPPVLAAMLATAFGAVLTGALHLDGLADTADGLGGGATKADALRIMRDSRIGTYGAVALIFDLGIKTAALAAMLPRSPAFVVAAVVSAGALSRWVPVLLGVSLPYARAEGGLGASLTRSIGRGETMVASVLAVAIALGCAGYAGVVLALAVVLFTGLCGAVFRRRLGGVTGDTLGAATELAETLVYVLALALAMSRSY